MTDSNGALKKLLDLNNPNPAETVKLREPAIKCLLVKVVMCLNCGVASAPGQPIPCNSKEQVKEVGNTCHSQLIQASKVLCLKPKLIIEYTSALLDSELLI